MENTKNIYCATQRSVSSIKLLCEIGLYTDSYITLCIHTLINDIFMTPIVVG